MNYNKAEFVTSYGLTSKLPASDRAEVVFSGRSNVGKSSLLNKLCNRKNLARVSATPGKTVTINFYRVDTVHFVDLPGYGYAKISEGERRSWKQLIDRYFGMGRSMAILVQLIDSRREPSVDDYQMMEYLHQYQIPFLVALTKCDKLKKSELEASKKMLTDCCAPYGCKKTIMTSASNGYGIDELKAAIDAATLPVSEE